MNITVKNASAIPYDQLDVERIPLGLPGDYKPMVVKLLNGDLLLAAFCGHECPNS